MIVFLLNKFSPKIKITKHAPIEKSKNPLFKTDYQNESIDKAKELFKKEECDKAAQIFDREIVNKENPVAYYYMAEIYNKRGYTKLAIKTYKKADDKKANFFEPKKRLASANIEIGEYDEALNYALSAQKINSKDIELLETLLVIYRYFDRYDDIINTHKKIVEVDKKNCNSNYYLADYYMEEDNNRSAIPYLKNLLDIGYNTNIAYALASSYSSIEHYIKAIEILDLIIKNYPWEVLSATYYKENLKLIRERYNSIHKKQNSV